MLNRSSSLSLLACLAWACGGSSTVAGSGTGGQGATGTPGSAGAGGESFAGAGGESESSAAGAPTTGGASAGSAAGGATTGGMAGSATTGGTAGSATTGGTAGSATGGATTGGTAGSATGGTGAVDCGCVVGAYVPVCGVDGATYDAACGRECVPVAIECDGICPCSSSSCGTDCAVQGLTCCDGSCVNTGNDPTHCGSCDSACGGSTPYCNLGSCEAPPCSADTCADPATCCGTECCDAGQICCLMMSGVWFSACTDPVDGTCPVGCPLCVCAAPDTPIATPEGDRPIAELEVGDWVYSVDGESIRPVPILRTNRAPVHEHSVVRVRLATGRTLEISAPHPTGDGRTFGELEVGSELDGVKVVAREIIPYAHPFTYDILPASSSGSYFAAGVEMGSTLSSTGSRPGGGALSR